MEVDLEAVSNWKRKKWGMFSASRIHHLLVPGTADKKTGIAPMFGKGALTYIHEIASQSYIEFNDEEDGAESFSMKEGKRREPIAAGYYQRIIGLNDMMYFGGQPDFYNYDEHSGCSPDLVVWKDEANQIASFGAEFKNPKRDTHMDYLIEIKNCEDLKNKCSDYYTQCQFCMMVLKADLWHWVSHHEYYPVKDRMLIIEVPVDKNFQADLEVKLSMAVKKKNEFVNLLKNR
jgi:hypothetical protein